MLVFFTPQMTETGNVLLGGVHQNAPRWGYCHYGFINQHFDDLQHCFIDLFHSFLKSNRSKNPALDFFQKRGQNIPLLDKSKVFSGKNLIFIQVESLQEGVVGRTIDGVEITPFLNKLKEQTLFFPNIFDQTNLGRSSDADFAVLNSLLPPRRVPFVFRYKGNDFSTLASVLSKKGYSTFSASFTASNTWNCEFFHKKYGFSETSFPSYKNYILDDRRFFSAALKKITSLKNPFFAFLVTTQTHHPYVIGKALRVPEPISRLSFPNEHKMSDVLMRYFSHMHYVDQCLKEFFEQLGKNGLLEKSIVVIYGDHDAEMQDEPALRSFLNSNETGAFAQRRVDRIPLFILFPQHDFKGDITEPGGHMDIAPTVLYYLGIKQPLSFMGSPVLPGRDQIVLFSNPWGAAITKDLCYVEGECLAFPSLKPLSSQSCNGLRKESERQLRFSEDVAIYNLVPAINARDKDA